ncbi:MAG: primosomal protein N', partial [Bacteroidales bacterium]|nr:primosomal protein N' [Bacteroidales bacterium]
MKYYAECILPVPLAQVFTYALTDEQSERACFGMRAIVPFGKTHKYTGIIIGITESAPEGFEIKEVLDLPDETPIIHVPQYELWKWIADYYMCPIGDVMKAALPSELKPEAGKNGVIREDFRPKYKSFIEVSLPFFSEISERNRKVAETLTLLKRAAKQQELFMKLLEMSHYLEEKKERAENVEQQKENGLVAQDELLKAANSTSSILKELIKRGLCRQKEIEIARLDFNEDKDIKTEPPFPLTEIQDEAFREICNSFKDKDVTLLHGVTSSGKTEIYIHLIQEVISSHKQALMMVPEIALTTQLCMRLQRVFGKRMLVYHSKLSNANRVEIWNKILKDDSIDLIVGVRSSIFLPFRELGLIIVDEEHETSYKQQDPAPRYHAREAAIILARKHGAKVLLGSATPSLETYYLAKQERFGYVRLSERHAGVSMPRISLISLREARKAESMMGTFTQNLIKAINQTILSGKQVILFQNRRGFSPNIECTV